MSDSWARQEVEAAVTDYFVMLAKELRGEPFNKAEHNRALQQKLKNRTRGSIERKRQNISAILIELGYPYIDGYKPLGNYQELLRLVVVGRLSGATGLNTTVEALVEKPTEAIPDIDDILAIKVDPPIGDQNLRVSEEPTSAAHSATRRNYLEIEARNQSLGRAGEEFILRFENERLVKAGQRNLAKEIRHVALLEGDNLGYDILSFEANGRERLIEVKTTRFGEMTPFFASRAEIDFSKLRDSEYQLYRLYSFRAEPKLYTLLGSLRGSCRLDPVTYSAFPNCRA
jgi:hypothetical protein